MFVAVTIQLLSVAHQEARHYTHETAFTVHNCNDYPLGLKVRVPLARDVIYY